MTTIAEKSADHATLIDDIYNAATALAAWSDADADVENDGDEGGANSSSWDNNGRVLAHADSGTYILMYLLCGNMDSWGGNHDQGGVRMVISNDWDATNTHPAGKTNVKDGDPFSADVGNHRQDSYVNESLTSNHNGCSSGLYTLQTNMSEFDLRSEPLNYFASVGASWLTVAAWSDDPNYGCAAWFHWEYVNSKFWADGFDPIAYESSTNVSGGGCDAAYAFQHYRCNNSQMSNHPFRVANGYSRGLWGVVNPDANDDTFFFGRPIAYTTHQKDIPAAYIYHCVSNDVNEGVAHGDEVTYDGNTYHAMRQSGGFRGETECILLKFE